MHTDHGKAMPLLKDEAVHADVVWRRRLRLLCLEWPALDEPHELEGRDEAHGQPLHVERESFQLEALAQRAVQPAYERHQTCWRHAKPPLGRLQALGHVGDH